MIDKQKLMDALRMMNELTVSGQKNLYIAFNTMSVLQDTITSIEEMEKIDEEERQIEKLNKEKPR